MDIKFADVSAAVAAATDRAHEPRPIHSRRWLGRPFVLTDQAMGWGRYTVPGDGASALVLRSVEPGTLARVFAEQLQLHVPDSVPDFEREVQALSAPHGIATALSAVFESAKPLHGVEAAKFEYIGPHQGSHICEVTDPAGAEYFVVFDRERVLHSVESASSDGRHVVWMLD